MARVSEGAHSLTCHHAFTPQPQSVTAIWPVLIFRLTKGRRLSYPEWLVTNQGGLQPADGHIPVLTGLGVE